MVMAPCRRCYAYGEIGALRRRSISACLFFTTTGALGSIWHLDGSQVTLTNPSNTVLLDVSRGSHQSSRSQMQAVSPAVLRLLRARSSASSESTSVNRISYAVSLDRLPRRVSNI